MAYEITEDEACKEGCCLVGWDQELFDHHFDGDWRGPSLGALQPMFEIKPAGNCAEPFTVNPDLYRAVKAGKRVFL